MLGFIGTQALGFILGVLACFVFWYLLVRVKPDIRIAPVAAYNVRKGIVGIKVANRSHRQATNVQVTAAVASKARIGMVTTRLIGQLRWDRIFALGPLQDINSFWGLPTTFIFICENGKELLAELERSHGVDVEARLIFTISAQDAVSGTILVRRTTYRRHDIIDGWYRPRLSFNVDAMATVAESAVANSTDPQE